MRHFVAVWHLLHVVVVAWVHGSAHHFPLICEVLNLFIMSSSLHVLQMVLDHNCVASIVAFSFNFALSQLFFTELDGVFRDVQDFFNALLRNTRQERLHHELEKVCALLGQDGAAFHANLKDVLLEVKHIGLDEMVEEELTLQLRKHNPHGNAELC